MADLNDKITYYTITQVSRALHIPDSKIRFWLKQFDFLFEATIVDGRRRYIRADIEKLEQIKILRESGASLKQIQNKFKNEYTNTNTTTSTNELIPLFSTEIKKELALIKEEILQSINIQFEQYLEIQKQNNKDLLNSFSELLSAINDEFNKINYSNGLVIEKAKNQQLRDLLLETTKNYKKLNKPTLKEIMKKFST